MARYIDADKLLEELQEEIDFKTSMYTAEQNKYFEMGLRCAYRDVQKHPTEDVVPRETIEQIFEEIRENSTYIVTDYNEELEVICWDDITELKKKYIGGSENE